MQRVHFSIQASAGEELVFTYVGHISSRIVVGNTNNVRVSLKAGTSQLEEGVVTAMDIRRNAKELGFSHQTVSGKDVQETQRGNL